MKIFGFGAAAVVMCSVSPALAARDDGRPRYYRAGVEIPPLYVAPGNGVEATYGERRAPGDYTTLADADRDAAIWSLVQQVLEEHLDFAFSLSSRSRGGYFPVGREICAAEVAEAQAARAPRYFRKADDRPAPAVEPPAGDAPTAPATQRIEIKGGRPMAQPAGERGSIQIIRKAHRPASDKQFSNAR